MEDSWRLARALAWAGTGSLALAATGLITGGDLRNGAVLMVFTAIAAALVRLPSWVPIGHTLVFVAVTLLDAAGMVFGLFDAVFFYDEMAHCLTTLAVTLTVGYAAFRPMRVEFRRHPLLLLLATACVGMSVGAAWEVYEYMVNAIGTVGDTIWDLVWDGLGATTAALAVSLREGLGQRHTAAAPVPQPVPVRAR